MISTATNTIILNAIISSVLDQITYISLSNSSGEYFRKALTNYTDINLNKRVFTFFISESEGNGSIVQFGLHDSLTLNGGTCYATQEISLVKDNSESLTLEWSVEVNGT